MSVPRVHHFVPVFYLNGFADPRILERERKRVIWVYEQRKTIRKSTPENEARKKDFYIHERGSLEKALSKMEGIIGPIFRKLQHEQYFVTESEKGELAQFVGLMFFRGPSGRQCIDKLSGLAMKEIAKEMAQDETGFNERYKRAFGSNKPAMSAEQMREAFLKGDFEIEQRSAGHNLKLMLLFAADLGELFASCNWQILRAPADQLFLTTDNPIASVRPDGLGHATLGVGFALPGTEVLFPLNARSCLRMKRGITDGVLQLTPQRVRLRNKTFMACARRFAYAPERSLSLKRLFDRVGCQLSYLENAFVPSRLASPDWEA